MEFIYDFFSTFKGQICIVFWCNSQHLGSGKKWLMSSFWGGGVGAMPCRGVLFPRVYWKKRVFHACENKLISWKDIIKIVYIDKKRTVILVKTMNSFRPVSVMLSVRRNWSVCMLTLQWHNYYCNMIDDHLFHIWNITYEKCNYSLLHLSYTF